MTQEEKDLLLKDLCGRLLHGVKCDISDGKPYTLCSISNDYYDGILIKFKEQKNGFDMEMYLSEVKPYLFPMSSMTEEQEWNLDKVIQEDAKEAIEAIKNNDKMFHAPWRAIDWLNKNHFDYRGLIPKGLANDATGLNIY